MLPEGQYHKEETPKSLIVLHHTVGGSAQSTLDWWAQTPERVGTAFVVDRDGTVYEMFDPKYWAAHLGIKGDKNVIDRRSIGIEMVGWGGLTKANGGFTALDGKKHLDIAMFYEGSPRLVTLEQPYRGYRYFEVYYPAQVTAVVALVKKLQAQFNISSAVHPTADRTVQGVTHHAALRPDKSDLHPGWDWGVLA